MKGAIFAILFFALFIGTAAAEPGIVMEITPIYDEVLPGETAIYEVNISYFMTFPAEEHVSLKIDNPIWNYSFTPAEFNISSGASKYSNLSIFVPSDAQPGTYEHSINATALGQIGPIVIKEKVTTTVETTVIPEFTSIAIPAAAILGLIFLFGRRKKD